jgi:acyl-CoA thioesterase
MTASVAAAGSRLETVSRAGSDASSRRSAIHASFRSRRSSKDSSLTVPRAVPPPDSSSPAAKITVSSATPPRSPSNARAVDRAPVACPTYWSFPDRSPVAASS